VLRWFGHVERMEDERIAKQVYNGRVNKRRMKRRPKMSWLNVVQKCVENKNVRCIKSGRHERICMNHPIMNVEAAKVCKDHKIWKNNLKGGLCPDVGLPQKGNGIFLCMILKKKSVGISIQIDFGSENFQQEKFQNIAEIFQIENFSCCITNC
jgi:hypothetical protein